MVLLLFHLRETLLTVTGRGTCKENRVVNIHIGRECIVICVSLVWAWPRAVCARPSNGGELVACSDPLMVLDAIAAL